MQRQQQGFTLIELVIVIVILGILSAFALPRFADLSGDAELATVEGARGSVASASSIVRSAALARDNTDGPIDLEGGESIELANGYAAAGSIEEAAQLADDFEVNDVDDNGTQTANIGLLDGSDGSPCFTYAEADADSAPEISQVAETGWDGSEETCDTSGGNN